MLTLITRLRQYLPSFSTLKFFFPHFLYCSLQKKDTMAAHTEEVGIYAQIPWRQTMSIYYWNCFTHEIFLFSPFIYIFKSFTSISLDSNVLHGVIMQFYFILHLKCWEFFQLHQLWISAIFPQMCVWQLGQCFFVTYSILIFYILHIMGINTKSAISLGNLGSFC